MIVPVHLLAATAPGWQRPVPGTFRPNGGEPMFGGPETASFGGIEAGRRFPTIPTSDRYDR
jgi:hypothetical protein